jgi:hypothetical protein
MTTIDGTPLFFGGSSNVRAVELWESMGDAAITKYDPWDKSVSTFVLQHRVKEWLAHPGFPKDC